MTIEEEKEEYVNYLSGVRNLSDRSVKCYEESLGILVDFARRRNKTDISSFDSNDAHEIMKIFFEKKLAAASVNRHLSSYRQFFAREVKKGVIDENPFALIRTNKKVQKIPVFLTKDELVKLIHYNEFSDLYDDILDRTVITVLIFTGIRREELITLCRDRIDYEKKEILIFGKGAKERIVFFTDYCKKVMQSYEKKHVFRGEFFFTDAGGMPITEARVNRIFKKIRKNGIIQKHVTPHVLRHSFASFLLENNVDIMMIKKLLGHESISATGVYTHVDFHRLIDVYDKVFE